MDYLIGKRDWEEKGSASSKVRGKREKCFI
jgi:hypothetical protein